MEKFDLGGVQRLLESSTSQVVERQARVMILGSGEGTNARKLLTMSKSAGSSYRCVILGSNKGNGGLARLAEEQSIPFLAISSNAAEAEAALLSQISDHHVDMVALAGYLRLIPPSVIAAVEGRIVNIHPALLPKYGGPGMFGKHVHNAVLAAGESVSGATVHLVTEHYDEGMILGQVACPVFASDDVESLAKRVQSAEHVLYPTVMEHFSKACGFRADSGQLWRSDVQESPLIA